ncbi:MAG: EI24 domain-containing protein [Saprospiraceae bacterium]
MITGIIEGLANYGAAIRHISRYRMWNYIMLPGILCAGIGIGIFSLAWGLSDNVGDWLDNLWPWDWGRQLVAAVAQLFGGLLVLLAGLLLFKQIIMVLLAPFMSLLSEKVEHQIRGEKAPSIPFSPGRIAADIVRGLKIALRNLIRELLITILLLMVGLIPIFTPFTTALIFLFQAYYAGFGNVDFALERHFGYRDSIRFVHKNRGLALGNGIFFIGMLFSFVGFLFALPLGTVAATIGVSKKLAQ